MSIFKQIDEIIAHIDKNMGSTSFNEDIFEILEGNLIEQVRESLKDQLSGDSFKVAMERVAPINVFRKVVDKRSTLYTDDVVRKTEKEQDQDLISHYETEEDINSYFQDANKGFNAYKYTTMELFIDDRKLQTRVLPSHFFLPYSDSKVNTLKVTAMIKFMGEHRKKIQNGKEVTVKKYWVYSATEFMAIDSDGELILEDMAINEGVNNFGVIPFVFISKSRYLLVPMPDKDDRAMSILIPVLLTDLNFAAKYMAHTIFYGVDLDSQNLKLSPDAFWNFKSDQDGKSPEIGTIKPEVSIDEILALISNELSAWLDTKNIKTGSMGAATDNASGIAKIIDEADTTIDRKQQIGIFKQAEKFYWRTLASMHNTAVANKLIDNTALFSDPETLKVATTYSDQKIIETRVDKVVRLKTEVEAGFRAKKVAMKELNPTMTEEEIEEEIDLINEEGVIEIVEPMDE